MNPIATCLPSSASALQQSPESLPTAQPLGPTATRTLWVRMAEIYGHRWTSSYGAESGQDGAAGTWAKGLAGISPEQIAFGLKACLVSAEPWPPTLPEFRAMCLGIPSLPWVKRAILAKDRSPFCRVVWQHIDGYLFGHADHKTAERMIVEAYAIAREYVMSGGQLPDESPMIEAQPEPPKAPARELTEDERRELFAEMRANLGLRPAGENSLPSTEHQETAT